MERKKINEHLLELQSRTEGHLNLGKDMLKADNSAMYPLDFLAAAALYRSLNLISGFCKLIEEDNFIAAAPLLRLQIDTYLRFFAAFIVNDPHIFAENIFKGEHVNKQKDKDGKRMTDRYLVEKLSELEPWVINVYKQTSGYIHLSDKHIFSVLNLSKPSSGDRLIGMLKIGKGRSFIPEKAYLEMIQAFIAATDLFLKYISGWVYRKDNPEKVKELEEKFKKKYSRLPTYKDFSAIEELE